MKWEINSLVLVNLQEQDILLNSRKTIIQISVIDFFYTLVHSTVGAVIVASLFGLGTLERSRYFSVSVCLAFITAILYPIALHWV